MNISLMMKWWWKLDNEKGLWQEIVRFKYLKKESICTVKHKQNDSAIWSLKNKRDIPTRDEDDCQRWIENFILERYLVNGETARKTFS
jgi:hypothetical protein